MAYFDRSGYTTPGSYTEQHVARNFMYKVFGWMAAALTLTGITAYALAQSAFILTNNIFFILFFIQLGLVIFISAAIQTISLPAASIAFIAYSTLNGIIFSTIFLQYTGASIASTFLITAGTFAFMAIYGYLTRTDLTGLGNIFFMLLIGLIIAMLVNIFLQSPALYIFISAAGVIIFTVLTAFDVQKIKALSHQFLASGEIESKVAILGALTLYLDFVNLFLMLLNFTGQRKEQ